MEDLIGFLVFVFYIISRVSKDRKRGMSRDPSQNEHLPEREFPWDVLLEPEPKQEIEYWEEPEPTSTYDGKTEQRPSYDGYETMEGFDVERNEIPAEIPVLKEDENKLISLPKHKKKMATAVPQAPQLSSAAMNLRQAVIWSEILQKPKALQKRGAFGHRYGS